jgi:hypothetical protein
LPLTRKITGSVKFNPSSATSGGGGTGSDLRTIASEVKKPLEAKYPWDYYKPIATIPADEAFIPLEKSVSRW